MNNKLLKIVFACLLVFTNYLKPSENPFIPSNETLIYTVRLIGGCIAMGILDAHIKGGYNLILHNLIINPTYRAFGGVSPTIQKNNSDTIMENHSICSKLDELVRNQKEIEKANMQLSKELSKKDEDRYEELLQKKILFNKRQEEYFINLRENVVDKTTPESINNFEREHDDKIFKNDIELMRLCHSTVSRKDFLERVQELISAKRSTLDQIEEYEEQQQNKKTLRSRKTLRREIDKFIKKSAISFEQLCEKKYFNKFSNDSTVNIKGEVSENNWDNFIRCVRNCPDDEYLKTINNLKK